MAKYTRTIVGSVLKSKTAGTPDYIKIKTDVTLKAGTVLRLENKAQQLKNLDEAVEKGRLGEDIAEKIRANINKIPDFVRFEVVQLEKNEA